jgi:hypothetical protein
MLPNGQTPVDAPPLSLGDATVPWVSSYKYLGVEIHGGEPFTAYRERAIASASRAAYAVSALGMHSGKLAVPLALQVYKTMVRPLLEHCAGVVSIRDWPEAEYVQLQLAKRMLQCPIRTNSEALRCELGLASMQARYQQARLTLWAKLLRLPSDHPARAVYDASVLQASDRLAVGIPAARAEEGWTVCHAKPSKPGLVPWCVQLRHDLYELGLAERWQHPESVSELSAAAWRTIARSAVTIREQARRWREVNLPTCSAAPLFAAVHSADAPFRCASYLEVQHGGWNDRMLMARQLLTRLRCGSHRLRVVTGRWDGDAACYQLCPQCATATKSVHHFLVTSLLSVRDSSHGSMRSCRRHNDARVYHRCFGSRSSLPANNCNFSSAVYYHPSARSA